MGPSWLQGLTYSDVPKPRNRDRSTEGQGEAEQDTRAHTHTETERHWRGDRPKIKMVKG